MSLIRYLPSPYLPLPSAAVRRRGFLRSAAPSGARAAAVHVLAANRVVLGCGLVTLDYLATVDAYPRPDDKIRSGELQISGGGNAGNALTGAARLGLNTRLISKVANDEIGGTVRSELEEAGIDVSHVIISDGGNTTFVYVIIDKKTKTRTCIITSGYPPMVPGDISVSNLSAALQDVNLLYLDGYSHEMALSVGKQADLMKIPILVDAEPERTKTELGHLLDLSSYIVCSGKFPEKWTSISCIPSALLEILVQYPRARFVIATLGENGCMMLERIEDDSGIDAVDIGNVAESLRLKVHKDDNLPTCVSSKFMRLSGRGHGTIHGRLLIGTAEKIPAPELVDTTGCGDAFIGAVLYGLCTEMAPEKMLPFACQVAGIKCRAIGARTGLPWRSDARLSKYLREAP
ncbi:ketohexokinase-like isoform X1 [Triticum dicoccoides]|uniref:ketohexokinase-like isoform X1 n=1 Tax=Triticum dicoccoides TaxID=85692 RepID=UPI00188F0E03|nr:ketohexokinase-like isoform X1 [Triticum dicoccoides]